MNDSSPQRSIRYEALAKTLRNRIRSGLYPLGFKLPSETELMDETGFSRSTVRRALQVLVDDGLLRKERGRGTFVAHVPTLDENEMAFTSFTSKTEASGNVATTRVVDAGRIEGTGKIAEFFGVAPGSTLIRLVRLRHLDDMPFCIETTYLPPVFAALIDEDLEGSLYATIRRLFHCAPGRGNKTFEVCFANPNEAFLLDVPRDTALMLITDYVHDTHGEPFHVSKRVMRTDRAAYTEPIG